MSLHSLTPDFEQALPKVGELIAGKYRVDSILGTGGMLTRLHWNHYTFRGAYPRDAGDGGLELDTFHGSWVGLALLPGRRSLRRRAPSPRATSCTYSYGATGGEHPANAPPSIASNAVLSGCPETSIAGWSPVSGI